jgi:photosystem II stability/assembly factor-like uncharacterized protein
MKKSSIVSTALPLCFLLCIAIAGCGGGNGSTNSGPPVTQTVSITVSPSSGFVPVTQTLQLNATVGGTTNQNVTWTVNGIPSGNASVGTVSASGLFTAPTQIPNPQKVSVAAISQADTTKSASATLLISRIPPSGAWQRTGPPGGTITVLAEDVSHPGTAYAGTNLGNLGALWKTTDFGQTWTSLITNTFVDNSRVFDIAVPPSGGGKIIYVCNTAFAVSQDGGTTWKQETTPASPRGMAVDPQDQSVIYVSAPGSGVLKSHDSGATWALLPGSPIIAPTSISAVLHNPLQVDLQQSSIVYYGTDHGMFVSHDSGSTWTQSTIGFAAGDTAIRDVAGDPASTGTVFALAGGPTSALASLYQSVDHGTSWTLLSAGLDGERVIPDLLNASIIYLSGLQTHAVYKSIDGGHTFAPSDNGMPTGGLGGPVVLSGATGTLMPFSARTNTFLSTIGGAGIFRSTDAAQSWSFSSSGLSAWQGLSIAVDPQQPSVVYLATSQAVFKSTDSGATWTEIQARGSITIAVDPFQSSHLLAEFSNQGLFESHDGGATWVAVTNLPPPPNGTIAFINAISFHPKVPGTIFISSQGAGILRSTDGGATYAVANNGLTNTQLSGVVANPQTPAMLFVGTAGGLFKSNNNGDSWTLSNPAPAGVISFDANVTPPTIYINNAKSTDLGVTWISIPGAGVIVADPSTPNSIFSVGGTNGPQWSPDAGGTFFPLTAGFGQPNVFFGFDGKGIVVAPSKPQVLFLGSLTNSILRFAVGP